MSVRVPTWASVKHKRRSRGHEAHRLKIALLVLGISIAPVVAGEQASSAIAPGVTEHRRRAIWSRRGSPVSASST